MRLRLSDPTLMNEFLEFLADSGFVPEREAADIVCVSIPVRLGRDRAPADDDFFLSIWTKIGLRVWNELWPEAEAVALAEADSPSRALSA